VIHPTIMRKDASFTGVAMPWEATGGAQKAETPGHSASPLNTNGRALGQEEDNRTCAETFLVAGDSQGLGTGMQELSTISASS
jgi:hypothetical protein